RHVPPATTGPAATGLTSCGTDAGSVERILQLLAGPEARLLGRLDGDLFAGLGISALAAGAGCHDKDAKAGEPHLFSGLEGGSDEVEDPIHGLGGIVLGKTGRIRKLLDEVVLVHGIAPCRSGPPGSRAPDSPPMQRTVGGR